MQTFLKVLVPTVIFATLAASCGQEKPATPTRNAETGPLAHVPWALGRWTPGTAPRFEDFPADAAFDGVPAAVDLASHPEAAPREAQLRNAVARGPNFAGRFAIVSWQEPAYAGKSFLIVDVATGQVHGGRTDVPDMEFRRDSRLIRYAPPEPQPGRVRCAGCTESFEIWDGEQLHLVPPELWAPTAPPPAAWRKLVRQTRAEEEPALAAGHAPHVVRPTWDRLVITAEDGTRRVLSDEVVHGELRSIHKFAGSRDPLPVFIVNQELVPEGRGVLMVDRRNGDLTRLDEIPASSPDGARFATSSVDLVAGHNPNRIRVYRMEPQGPVLEWEAEPREWGARNPFWVDETTIRLERVVIDWNTHGSFNSPMLLRPGPGGWTSEPSIDHAIGALRSFLSALGVGNYNEATLLFGGTYGQLRAWNPGHDPEDRSGLWRLACEHNGLRCLGRAEVVRAEHLSPTEARIAVHLLDRTGEPFVQGPCCGETEQSMPPQREFTFHVRRMGEQYLVMDLPPYVP